MATRRALARLAAAGVLGVALLAAAALSVASTARAQVEPTDPDTVSGTLARIKKTGVVRIGYRDASIPFSFLDRAGRPIGYSIDLCGAIVEEIGRTLDRDDLKVEFVKVTSEDRLDAVVDNRIDLECGSTTNNLERRKRVDFSPMIFVSGTKVMVPVATSWRDFHDLKGKKVAVTRGTTNAEALASLDKKFGLGMTLVEGADHEESYGLLADGKVDAFATDDVLLYGLIAQHRAQNRFKVVGELLSYDPYGIAFRRNEKTLRDTVERAIRNLVIARDIGPMYDKWFSSRLPNGERFNIPMSPQLEQSFTVLGATGEAN
jgi:glutamate/aspartate transport system substrate-binding protein